MRAWEGRRGWGFRYNDGDVVYVAAEYFYNQAGYDDASLYLWLLVQGGFQPLYLGRHYAALAVILPALARGLTLPAPDWTVGLALQLGL